MPSIPSPFSNPATGLAAATAALQSDVVESVAEAVTDQVSDIAKDVALPIAKFAVLHFVRTRARMIVIALLLLVALPIGLKLLWDAKKGPDDPTPKDSAPNDTPGAGNA